MRNPPDKTILCNLQAVNDVKYFANFRGNLTAYFGTSEDAHTIGEIYGIDFIPYSDEIVFFIGYEYEEKMPYLELIAYMKRAIKIFLGLNNELKSNLDVYFMIKR